jgi:methionyl-tRNA synthetase
LNEYDIQKAIRLIWKRIQEGNQFIQEKEPFKKIKTDPEEAKKDIAELLKLLWIIGNYLKPFLPKTSMKIFEVLEQSSETKVPLFPRIS